MTVWTMCTNVSVNTEVHMNVTVCMSVSVDVTVCTSVSVDVTVCMSVSVDVREWKCESPIPLQSSLALFHWHNIPPNGKKVLDILGELYHP